VGPAFRIVVGIANVQEKDSVRSKNAFQLLEWLYQGLNILLDCRFMPDLTFALIVALPKVRRRCHSGVYEVRWKGSEADRDVGIQDLVALLLADAPGKGAYE